MVARTRPPERPPLAVEYVAPELLRPNPKNPRRHSRKAIAKLELGVSHLGFNCPILADETWMVLAGHLRLEVAKRLKMSRVPCIRITHLSEHDKTAFLVADNRLADESQFDPDAMAAIVEELIGSNYRMDLTGLDAPQIDMILETGAAKPKASSLDDIPPEHFVRPAVSRPGDLWVMGRHRLVCANSLDEASYPRLLGEARAQMVLCDPPYNVRITNNVSGLGRIRHREFAMASGEMSPVEFRQFLSTAMERAIAWSEDGSLGYYFMDWRHIADLIEVGRKHYAELKNICVWDKQTGALGSLYRSQHEMVAVFKNGTAAHLNNVELGKHGRYRTNLWSWPGVNAFGPTRDDDLSFHPTVKPVGLLAEAIRDCTRRGSTVLDHFAGSGSTLLASERTGRRAVAVEIDPLYVDVAVRRWQRLTGQAAVLEEDGRTFADLEHERLEAVDQPSDEEAA